MSYCFAAEPVEASAIDTFYAVFEQYGLKRGVVFPTYGLAEHTVYVCRLVDAHAGNRVTAVVAMLVIAIVMGHTSWGHRVSSGSIWSGVDMEWSGVGGSG